MKKDFNDRFSRLLAKDNYILLVQCRGMAQNFGLGGALGDDVYQDFLLKVVEKKDDDFLQKYEARGRPYILSCIRKRMIDNLRKRKTRTQNEQYYSKLRDFILLRTLIEDKERTTQFWTKVRNTFNEKEIELSELRFLQELKYKEIARILAIPEGTVAIQIKRIRAKFKKHRSEFEAIVC